MEEVTGIPVYEARIDGEGTGMTKISLVDSPAVMSDFLALAAERRALAYRVEDEERRLVRGVVMRADFPIYRRDERFGEYYIVYRADTIRQMAEQYLGESRQNEVNLQHEEGSDVEGVRMVQWFIKDTAAGIAPEGFDGVADGSLFAEFHVVNDEVWEAVKDGTYRGFSLEGVFELKPEGVAPAAYRKFVEERHMSKIRKIREALARALQELGSVATDRGALEWDGEDDLRAGMEVYTTEGGERTAAPDGDYRTEDGKVIRVSGGKVSEITDDRAEVGATAQKPESAPAPEKTPARLVCEAFSMSYDDRERLIWEALTRKVGTDDMYLAEAGDDYAVAMVYDRDWNAKYMRYAVTWNGDTPEIGEGREVRLAYVPSDMEVTFEAVSAERDSLRAELEAARAELQELRARPLARPAHEEVKGGAAPSKTGDRGIDRLSRYLSAE